MWEGGSWRPRPGSPWPRGPPPARCGACIWPGAPGFSRAHEGAPTPARPGCEPQRRRGESATSGRDPATAPRPCGGGRRGTQAEGSCSPRPPPRRAAFLSAAHPSLQKRRETRKPSFPGPGGGTRPRSHGRGDRPADFLSPRWPPGFPRRFRRSPTGSGGRLSRRGASLPSDCAGNKFGG